MLAIPCHQIIDSVNRSRSNMDGFVCGFSGNDLRALELEILLERHSGEQRLTADQVASLSRLDVDQMHGIEIEEFPVRIAEVALWLADHQANVALSEAFGQLYRRIPLQKSPHIVCANALRVDWKTVLPPEKCSYVLGNPPFVGKQYMSDDQKEDLRRAWKNSPGTGVLDFVTAWHALAADYMRTSQSIRCAFVSTNSICQGEQAGLLWGRLLAAGPYKIHFAHRTFAWTSEARGKAHVHCIIVGFGKPGAWAPQPKLLYDYDTDPENPAVATVANISPYLVEGGDAVVTTRSDPLCQVPPIVFGSMPNDGGNLLLSTAEKDDLLKLDPSAAAFVRPFLGSQEFINGQDRWCLWLKDASPAQLRAMPEIMKRVEAVKANRAASTREATRKLAAYPTLFGEDRQPGIHYLAIPKTSSERRLFIPAALLPPDIVASTELFAVAGASDYHFGVITSTMHMAWMRQVAGRLESRYRYSAGLVYNNFPWPVDAAEAQRAKVEKCAQAVLAAREQFPGSTLADLYDPLTMPPKLAKAHEALDRAVERCYRKEPFQSDRQRVEFLFALYEQLTAPLAVATKAAKRKSVKRNPWRLPHSGPS
jgi:hypothetical protein